MAQHSHSYSGTTTFNAAHLHHYGGVTAKAASGVPHVHYIEETTTYNQEHEHIYATTTGPAIFFQNGLHHHYFQTKVEFINGHLHYIHGFTSAD